MASVSLEEFTAEYMYSNPQGIFNLSCPEKAWRTPQYTNLTYTSFRIKQLKEIQEATGQEFSADDLLYRTWGEDAGQAPTVLKVLVKSKAPRMIRVGIKLAVADNASKNVNLPLTEMKIDLFASEQKQAFLFFKIDPTMDGWGDITCEVSVKQGKTTQISSSAAGGSYSSYTPGGFCSSGTSMSNIDL